jgi:hypothetical protein
MIDQIVYPEDKAGAGRRAGMLGKRHSPETIAKMRGRALSAPFGPLIGAPAGEFRAS